MPACSRAPRFLLCLLFPILSVLISSRNIRVSDTPARGILKLSITVTDHVNPCSPILAEEDDNVLVTVKNGGSDSVSVRLTVVPETDVDSPDSPNIQPLVMVVQAGNPDATFILDGMEYHTVPASQTRNYIFKATQGSYKCTGFKGRSKNIFVVIVSVRNQEHQQRSGDLVATRPGEDQYVAPIDNGQHESIIIHHPGVPNELAEPAGNDLIAAKNEAPGIDNLFVLADNEDVKDFTHVNHHVHVHEPNACEHPTTTVINCGATNWTSEEHRRTCLARIVNTVYCGDNNNVTTLALSLKNTGFRLHGQPLSDGGDMYAAIYKYEGQVHKDAPDIIVAFRGTQMCLKWSSVKDNCFNCIIGVNAVEYNKRFKRAYRKVKELTSSSSSSSSSSAGGGERGRTCRRVWLTGHSQGASLALHVGRQAMLEKEISLPTFAFNPPLAMVCWFPDIAKKFIGTMTPASSGEQTVKLSKWTPVLYVHDNDFLFCRCYIRCLMRPTQLDKWVTKLPSAMLCRHSGEVQGNFLERWLGPHSLHQWFNQLIKLNCEQVTSSHAGGDNLNCQAIESSSQEDCCMDDDDIEAQTNQYPQDQHQHQHAPPTGPSTSTRRISQVLGVLGATLVGTTAWLKRRFLKNPFGSRRRTRHIPGHGWWATLVKMVDPRPREHQM